VNDKGGGQAWWPMVVAVLGIFGISNMRGGGPTVVNPSPSSESASKGIQGSLSSQTEQEPALQVVESFLLNKLPDLPPEEQSAFERCVCQALQKLSGDDRGPPKEKPSTPPRLDAPWKLQTMIVDVPNPIESAVSYHFDAVVESLQFAMSAEGFVLDRYRLPWFDYQDRLSVDPKLKVKLSERTYGKHPGALLFRGTDPCNKELILMLLVGENPLSGVYKQAFSTAVQIILKDLPKRQTQAPHLFSFKQPQQVSVLGPYFSGSADSLALSISEYKLRDKAWSFRVVAGGAMNVDKSAFVKRCLPAKAEFHATLVRADLLKSSLIDFVRDHDRDWTNSKQKIAWLTESNTGFGVLKQVKPENPPKVADYSLVDLPFPIHISRVRGSFSDAAQTAQQDVPNLSTSRLRLRIPFEDSQPARDVIPEFTPGMTATTAELLLNQIMTTIARARFRYVGITATDARDRIFLAGYIRKACPDVQLLIIESDLLFTHPESRSFMKGAIIASSYAVTQQGRLGPEERSRPEGRHIEFPTDYCQGMYNAAIILRNYECFDMNFDSANRAPGPPTEGNPLRHALRGYETIWAPQKDKLSKDNQGRIPPTVRQPGIWLSVVGNDELWPLEHCSIESAAERLFNLDPTVDLAIARQSQVECPPPTSEQDRKEQDLRELLNYTFSTWPNLDLVGTGDPRANDNLPNAERIDSGPLVRTHLNAFDRTLFCVVLFFGLYEVTRHSRRKSFWKQFDDLELPRSVDSIKTRITAATWFVLQAVAVMAVTSFATWLLAIRISDEVNQFPRIDRDIWWFVPAAVVSFELAGVAWLFCSEDVGGRFSRRTTYLLLAVGAFFVVIGALCLEQFLGLVISTNHRAEPAEQRTLIYFLFVVDLGLFVLGCVVTAGIVRFLAWEASAAAPGGLENGIATLMAVIVALLPCLAGTYVDARRHGLVFFYERSAHALNGVSLWSALLLLAGAFYLFAYQQEQGMLLDEEGLSAEPPWPNLSKDISESHSWIKHVTAQFENSRQALGELLCHPLTRLWKDHSGSLCMLVGIIVLWSAMLVTKIAPWMYDNWYSAVYWTGLSLFFWVWVFWLYSIVTYFKELERLFDRITTLPFLDSFKRLPDSLAPYFGRVLFRIHYLRTDDRRIAITYLNALKERKDSIGTAVANMSKVEATNWNRAFGEELTGKKFSGDKLSGPTKRPCRDALNVVAQTLWEKNLIDEWQNRSPDRAFAIGGGEGSENTLSAEKTDTTVVEENDADGAPKQTGRWTTESKIGVVTKEPRIPTLALADDFVLIQLIYFCNPLLRHAWRSFYCVAGATLLFLLAIASYGAQPQGFFGTTAVGMTILLGVLTGILVWRTERSELLSRFSGTTPGNVQFDWAFIVQSVVLLLLPVLVLINYAFPGAFDWLGTMLAPLFHVMK
jgi:hypothetical protein